MALNLLKSGSSLVVWNRSAAKCDEFVEKGATMAASAADVVRQSDVTYSMLSTPEVAKAVFYAEDGTLAGVSAGKKIVDCATLDPATMQSFHKEVTAKGGSFLEAPVSGSKGISYLHRFSNFINIYFWIILFFLGREGGLENGTTHPHQCSSRGRALPSHPC